MTKARRLSVCLLAVAVGVLVSLRGDAQRLDVSIDALALPPQDGRTRIEICDTPRVRAQRLGLRPLEVLADGRAVSFQQEPAILTPDYGGEVRLRDFLVAGDVGTVRFKVLDRDASDEETETWTRTGTRTINGRTVSVFNPSWPASTLARALRADSWGWDFAALDWGEFIPEGVAIGKGQIVRVRIASTRLPQVRIARLADDVQYSSHVVNLRLPGFGDTRLGRDDRDFDLVGVARKFYEHFEDGYDVLAVIPHVTQLASYGGYHRTVKNEVRGIGERIFDSSANYGSSRLNAIEVLVSAFPQSHALTVHEIGHQWGSYVDWTRLTSLTRAGSQPEAHDPLWAEHETPIGGILPGSRRVRAASDGWILEQTPAPVRFHPLMLYSMGLIPRDEVPTFTLFDSQSQFDDDAPLSAGTAVTGATRTATIFNIIGMLGERTGPTPTEWNRAVIVVSRDGLMSQREMDYWTFFAQRSEDPNRTGVLSLDGYASFDVATGGRIDLKQDIRPRSGARISQPLPVDFPDFGPDDWRDVKFDAVVPSRYTVGPRHRWSGVVRASDRNDISSILIRFWKYGGTTDDAIRVAGRVSSASSFVLEHQFEERHRGRYFMEVFLFWPDAPAQFPRSLTTPVTIE